MAGEYSHVSGAQAGKTGGLVAASGLDANEAVLNLSGCKQN